MSPMGKRGPKPKPSALKKAQGTYRPDRAPKSEVKPTPGIPDCPKYLDAIARAEWNRIVPELAKLDLLTKVDGAVLEGFCANYSAAVKFQALADKKPIVKTPFGPKTNPAVTEARKAWALCRQFGAELGLSPSARTRVEGKPKEKEEDKDEGFLFGGAPKLTALPGGAT